jgi:putative transposase
MGEIKKLGIRSISRNTVKRILKEAGLDSSPECCESTWDEFLKLHAASLWQVDFFLQRVLTLKGIREAFVIVFLNVKTRQVIVSPAMQHPDETWCVAQAESFVDQARTLRLPVKLVQHDRDSKFSRLFDQRLKSLKVQIMKVPYRSPNLNTFVERFIQSLHEVCSWNPVSRGSFGRDSGDRSESPSLRTAV